MKYFLSAMCVIFFQFAFACDCVEKEGLDIKDWNDTDLIYKAKLTEIKKKGNEQYLTFSVSKVYKGKTNEKSIQYKVEVDNNHNIFHHVDTMFKGQKWLIFSSSYEKNGKIVLELNRSSNPSYCMLSKPIIRKDPYLDFINEIIENKNSSIVTYFKDSISFAVGSLKNSMPTGTWKYYTRKDLEHYWEGVYVDGKKDGKWVEKAKNYLNDIVVIIEEIYIMGHLKERIVYNYINEKINHTIYDEK